jgi:hypothetical protein
MLLTRLRLSGNAAPLVLTRLLVEAETGGVNPGVTGEINAPDFGIIKTTLR